MSKTVAEKFTSLNLAKKASFQSRRAASPRKHEALGEPQIEPGFHCARPSGVGS
jgi:hypothetical protein